jgi:hypothetical protein
VTSQKSFGFMAAPSPRQWICHSLNTMKTNIFAGKQSRRGRNPTQASIRFDSAGQGRVERLFFD